MHRHGGLVDGTGGVGEPRPWAGARSGLHRSAFTCCRRLYDFTPHALQTRPRRAEAVNDRVVIDRRFNGPPNSANGGYTCGVVGTTVKAPAVSVSLRRPPPLDVPLRRQREDDCSVSLVCGEDVIATAVPAAVQAQVPQAPTVEGPRSRRAGTWASCSTGSRRASSAGRRAMTACGSTPVASGTVR